MTEVSPAELKRAVEAQHRCTATPVSLVRVRESFQGEVIWDGVVHVFDLAGNRKAQRAYAWSSPVEGGDKRRFCAVLHMGPIRGAADAVRAIIVAEKRAKS